MSIGNISANARRGAASARQFLNSSNSAFLSPKTARGISGWEFDIPAGEAVNLSADITDHFTEDNSYINDHIVQKPVKITLSGFKGVKVYRRSEAGNVFVNELDNLLSPVEAYLGEYTPGFIQDAQRVVDQAQSAIALANSVIDKAENIVGLLSSPFSQSQTEIEKAYQDLSALMIGVGGDRILLTVQTPFAYFSDMVIETIAFRQDADSLEISDISITLKQFRTASLRFSVLDDTLSPARVDVQKSSESDQGIVKGEAANESALIAIVDAARGGP